MKLRMTVVSLALALAFGAACNKPSSTNSDSSSAPGATPGSADTQNMAGSSQPRIPEEITIPSGRVSTVPRSDGVGSKISQAGQSFGGSLARPVEVKGETVIPAGARVSGEVVDAEALGRFAGGALLELRLNSVSIQGEQMPVQTATFTQTLKGKGKRTAVVAGGGPGIGALLCGRTGRG